jgi:hypothetical protein
MVRQLSTEKQEGLAMSQDLNGAIEAIKERIASKMQEVTELKKAANALCRDVGRPALYDGSDMEQESAGTSALRPDQYFRKPVATAVEEYIKYRRQACLATEILEALEAGGFDFAATSWKPKDRLRSLSVLLSKNPKFVKLSSGAYGLASMYPAEQGKRSGRSENGRAENGEENNGTSDDESGTARATEETASDEESPTASA